MKVTTINGENTVIGTLNEIAEYMVANGYSVNINSAKTNVHRASIGAEPRSDKSGVRHTAYGFKIIIE